ncbi:hypothetical protein D9756_004954 [Leucocoprinus leucothites]|uniref:Protein kinase domain-containing protein n=1 Tax=Leucocoprinus leucothites TaxID=201217 RepID=A0A8H5G8T3_9AGAR|nr:hypothetical protein D9756_004954 [Leucoagaricus leucothites]
MKKILTENITSTDRVIAVMGPTDSGQSNFIDALWKGFGFPPGYQKNTCAGEIECFLVGHHQNGHNFRIVLVVIPGFDNPHRNDAEVLIMMSDWFENTYRRGIKMTGILYLQRISDNRMSGVLLRNLRMFGELCGDRIMPRVLFVTTMWNQVDETTGKHRERELKGRFWKDMLAWGARSARFRDDYKSAQDILDLLVAHKRRSSSKRYGILLLQEEMVDLGKLWNETHAAHMLREFLLNLSAEQKISLKRLQRLKEGNITTSQLLHALQEEERRAWEEYRRSLDGIRALEISRPLSTYTSFPSTKPSPPPSPPPPPLESSPPPSSPQVREPSSTFPPFSQEALHSTQIQLDDVSEDPATSTQPDDKSSGKYPDIYYQSIDLVSKLLSSHTRRGMIADLKGDEAQCMVNFLHQLLCYQNPLDPNDRRDILSLLCRLTQSSQMIPEQCKITGVICDLHNPINEGGYGRIYMGDYRNQIVCVKMARIAQAQSNENMLKTKVQARELSLWTHLSHRNVLPFYGVYFPQPDAPQTICIISPWMQNGDLKQYLDAHPNAPKIPLIVDIITGLQYIHNMNIVHADLKANNVLVSPGKRALLADFGISRVCLSQVSTSVGIGGAASWMAPELLIGNLPSVTMSSDIWSFGCVCYEMFIRKRPYHYYEQPTQLIIAFFNGHPTPLQLEEEILVDPGILTLMKLCWERDPAQRPDCARIQTLLSQTPKTSDENEPDDSTFSQIWRARHNVKIDYQLVYGTLCYIHRGQAAMNVEAPSKGEDESATHASLA